MKPVICYDDFKSMSKYEYGELRNYSEKNIYSKEKTDSKMKYACFLLTYFDNVKRKSKNV